MSAHAQVEKTLVEQGGELQVLQTVEGAVCAQLSPLAPATVPLIKRLRELPDHVERIVVEGAFHGSSMALEQMVSHFDEINAAVIAKGFAADRSDEELDLIEEQVCPHAKLITSCIIVKTLLTRPPNVGP